MKKLLLVLLCLLPTFLLVAQNFSGTSLEEKAAYSCDLRINSDSSVNFIYSTRGNVVYGEYLGSISKMKDSLYHISLKQTFGQYNMKSFHPETLYISIDTIVAHQLNKIQIRFTNNTYLQLRGYDQHGRANQMLKIPIDEQIFNARKGYDYITITVNRKNYLSDDFLSFDIPFGSAASFTKGELLSFDVIIYNKQLSTTGKAPLQTGHFLLKTK